MKMNPKFVKSLVIILILITIGGGITLYFLLNSKDTGGELTIDQMVEFSYTTEEMRTDLKDGNFVLIQFQFITDSKAGAEEIAKREFQVKNEFIKQSVDLTEKDFRENLAQLEDNIQAAMSKKMTEGKITNVLITSKVIQ